MRVAHAEGIDESIENPEPVFVEGSGCVWIEVPMDFELTEEQRMLKDTVARFVAEKITPRAADRESSPSAITRAVEMPQRYRPRPSH